MSTTTPAVYVGTYHKYNCGSIFGKWFDLTDFEDEDEFHDACRQLHANEPDPEFMFQDWEGIPSQFASESSVDWTFIEAYKRAKDEGRDAAFIAWADYTGECDYNAFDDAYRGEAESEEDFAQQHVEDCGLLSEVPDTLRSYFDYEAYARDLFSSGYVLHDGYVFSN
ncbi:antirestriction protein ArdA [Cronobacter sakazakii]|uniref:antirestriction protein ArdA n=1 Tax=Cronobacter TaxID=413496 RepID=UPI000BE866DB|nr:antirestriction protein ArdA [Cronobacter sakazakii]ELY7546181.1 antirestriction protein ArdA [Cronobacter turicensis]ELY9424869.1 antirestriction protein ArdA [Cronobacter dublinensis]ELY6169644.1 antirestriction protein ArdA [Cronobacter sakazakii]ELY6251508.1 antirestriction protein ArdA [Cronobacter sakazakii]PQV65631.1 antirestriction protein [Cronobacter sakazakii]